MYKRGCIKGLLVISIFIVGSGSYAATAYSSYKIKVVRVGKTTKRLSKNYWEGEWPNPILNVGHNKNKFITVKVFKSLRKLDKNFTCKIKSGLYHPWSNDKTSLVNFYTISRLDEYRVRKTVTIEKIKFKNNNLLSEVQYLAEGQCQGKLIKNPKRPKRFKKVSFSCHVTTDKEVFKKTSLEQKEIEPEQWLYLKCKNGKKGFILDEVLAKTKGVVLGAFDGYGKVKAKPVMQKNENKNLK